MTNHPVTPEMSAAWRTLQAAAKGAYRLQPEVRNAINTIDNSDFMAPVEDAELRTTHDREILRLANEAKAEKILDEVLGTPLDPAEWGDTTREDMARHQAPTGE